MRLEGRTALVTGGASGIGAATARRLAAEGAHVIVGDLDLDGAGEVVAEIDGTAIELDVADVASAHAAIAQAMSDVAPIDILVNNAGTDRFAFFVNTDEELWDFVLGVNLKGVLNCTHAVLPSMHERGGGAIVNVASEAGRVGSQGSVTYSAAKAGVIGFTKAIARESARYGVRSNAVAPGPIETPLLNAAPVMLGEHRRAAEAGDDRQHRDAPVGRAGRGRRRDRVPRLRRRLVRHRPDAERQRRPLDVVSPGAALPAAVRIREVGPRDGFQNEPEVIATAEKVRLVDLLAQTGLRRIEVTSFVRPDVIPQLSDGAAVLAAIDVPADVAISVLIPNAKGLDTALALLDAHTGERRAFDEVNVFLSASESHNRANVNRSVEESLTGLEAVLPRAREAGLRCEGVISVAFGCPYEGRVEPARVFEIAERLIAAGAQEIGFGDTTGMANPRQVRAFFDAARERLGDTVELTAHFHNTRGQGLANVLAALEAGCESFESSFGELGGCPVPKGATGQHRHRGPGLDAARDGHRDRGGPRAAARGRPRRPRRAGPPARVAHAGRGPRRLARG